MKRLYCLSLLFTLLLTTACTSLDNVSVESLLAAKETGEESFASTQEAYLLYPDDERVLYNYAYMLLYYGRYDDAVRICDGAMDFDVDFNNGDEGNTLAVLSSPRC